MSAETESRAVTRQPWDGSASRWPDAASYCRSCLIDDNPAGAEKTKSLCHLPVKEPNGDVNANALPAALAALRGGRGGVNASAEGKAAALRKLRRLYGEAGMNFPEPRAEAPPREDLYRADFAGDLEIRVAEDGRRVMSGHFARFHEWAEIRSAFEGRFLERIAPGAFRKTFRENAERMRVLFQHGRDVLGEQILGAIRTLREDDRGAYYEVSLFDSVPDLVVEGLAAGQYGSSFRFRVMNEDMVQKPGAAEHNPEGLPERTITEAMVREFGPVTFPAYAGATASVRSLTDEFALATLIANPDRLRELIDAATIEPENEEPERSDATTPPAGPERSDATTRRSKTSLYGMPTRRLGRHRLGGVAKPWQL